MPEIKIMGQINIFLPPETKFSWGKKIINKLGGGGEFKTTGNPGKLMMHVN